MANNCLKINIKSVSDSVKTIDINSNLEGSNSPVPIINLVVNGKDIVFEVDCGASVSIIHWYVCINNLSNVKLNRPQSSVKTDSGQFFVIKG